ncbi:hypothetical protein POP15_150 [Pectobacterium phage POP15]|nr:hypothetical protein POP15_150 [Pectobacterium phage POP15]
MDLKINRTINSGVMFFIPENEDQYDTVESKMIQEFAEQPFGNIVAFNVDDGEFFQYWLSADIADEAWFHTACQWVIDRMKEHGATLDYVA